MLEKIINIIAEQLCIDSSEINENTNLKNELGIDSLDLFEIIMKIEDEYNIEISEDEVMNFNTVIDIICFLKNKGLK